MRPSTAHLERLAYQAQGVQAESAIEQQTAALGGRLRIARKRDIQLLDKCRVVASGQQAAQGVLWSHVEVMGRAP